MRGSLLGTKTWLKDSAALKMQFPAYIQAWQALAPSHNAGSSPPKERPACSCVLAGISVDTYVWVHRTPKLWRVHSDHNYLMQAGLLIE